MCIEADDPKLRSLAVLLLSNIIYTQFSVALEAYCGREKSIDKAETLRLVRRFLGRMKGRKTAAVQVKLMRNS